MNSVGVCAKLKEKRNEWDDVTNLHFCPAPLIFRPNSVTITGAQCATAMVLHMHNGMFRLCHSEENKAKTPEDLLQTPDPESVAPRRTVHKIVLHCLCAHQATKDKKKGLLRSFSFPFSASMFKSIGSACVQDLGHVSLCFLL